MILEYSDLIVQIDKIIEKSEKLGYNLNNFKKSFIQRRVNARMRINKIRTYDDYIKLLDVVPTEFQSLLQNLSINVTEFFRDHNIFSILSQKILPTIIDKHNNIKICSAGCASGEEPHTLAIICNELLSNYDFKFKIYAYDRNIDALTRAKKGVFLPNSVKNISDELSQKYFKLQNDGNYFINNNMTEHIQFTQWDLLKILPVNDFDIVLCRNVVIYLDTPARQQLFKNFYNVLKKSGYLVIGLSEVLDRTSSSLFTPIYSRDRIYQRY